jgi:uncharacterized membrane protein
MMLWVLLLSCVTEEFYSSKDTTESECSTVSYANVGEAFMVQYCLGCHAAYSSNRQGAPVDVTLDSLEDIRLHIDQVRHEIESQTMPPSGGVEEEQLALILDWLDCEVQR